MKNCFMDRSQSIENINRGICDRIIFNYPNSHYFIYETTFYSMNYVNNPIIFMKIDMVYIPKQMIDRDKV